MNNTFKAVEEMPHEGALTGTAERSTFVKDPVPIDRIRHIAQFRNQGNRFTSVRRANMTKRQLSYRGCSSRAENVYRCPYASDAKFVNELIRTFGGAIRTARRTKRDCGVIDPSPCAVQVLKNHLGDVHLVSHTDPM